MPTDGDPVAGPDHWWGFPPRTAIGLEFHRLGPGLKGRDPSFQRYFGSRGTVDRPLPAQDPGDG
ncbi:MAG: hypothetical protein U5R48_14360 [Gammaproteobacteria bacterium]|nr:hypothetical protein [Gammaproteobacteria bacterium]